MVPSARCTRQLCHEEACLRGWLLAESPACCASRELSSAFRDMSSVLDRPPRPLQVWSGTGSHHERCS